MIEIRKLQKNNIFYYAGKVYIMGWAVGNAGSFSAMETHSEGKHRTFKPETKVLFISPSFMKKVAALTKNKHGFCKMHEPSKIKKVPKYVSTINRPLDDPQNDNEGPWHQIAT